MKKIVLALLILCFVVLAVCSCSPPAWAHTYGRSAVVVGGFHGGYRSGFSGFYGSYYTAPIVVAQPYVIQQVVAAPVVTAPIVTAPVVSAPVVAPVVSPVVAPVVSSYTESYVAPVVSSYTAPYVASYVAPVVIRQRYLGVSGGVYSGFGPVVGIRSSPVRFAPARGAAIIRQRGY